MLHERAPDRAVTRVLPPPRGPRLRGRRRAPRVAPGTGRRAHHAPLPARGRPGGVPGRVRQVHRRAARRADAVSPGERAGMERFFHVGIVVPDLEGAQAYYTELLGLAWGPVFENDVEVRLGDGREHVFPNKIVYSSGPPHLELIEEAPGSPWVCNEHSNLHHIGIFTDDLGAEADRFVGSACPLEMLGGHGDGPPSTFTYHRDPWGVRIELVDGTMRPTMEQLMFPLQGLEA